MEQERLYMMAIMPPVGLRERIEDIRKEFAGAYNCKAALKPPVHITLYPPYKDVAGHEPEIRNKLSKWCGQQESFEIRLKGFGAFRENRVIFIAVEKNEALKELHRGFATQMTKILEPEIKSRQVFHPHITIGYRDIPEEAFPEAMKDFLPRKFDAVFNADSISFWRHNGRNWETIASFPLQKEAGSVRQSSLF